MESDPHQDLLSKKGGRGFPHLVFMDEMGNVLATHKGSRSAEGFAETGKKALETIKKLAELKKKAEEGDPAAKKEYLILRLDLGRLTSAEAKKELKDLKLSEEEKADLEARILNLEINEILVGVTKDKATQVPVGKKFAEIWKSGRAPTGENERLYFYYMIMAYAEDGKDAETFEKALEAFKRYFGDNSRY
ncbi:MAG: hypothetical protein ACYTAF_14305, partial [Planctomycetota bacterium]